MPMKQHVAVDNRELKFSNLDKVYFPESGFTKGEVLTSVSDPVLPSWMGTLTIEGIPGRWGKAKIVAKGHVG